MSVTSRHITEIAYDAAYHDIRNDAILEEQKQTYVIHQY